MESDKSRGLKHIKDKRKYKSNTTKNAKYVPPKTKPNLESNWYRYEKEDSTEEQYGVAADADFAILASAPITKGKHFQTKSDKLLASETEATDLGQLFTLNLEHLEESILTIPFYKRLNIDEDLFLESQIKFMNSEANEHLEKFIKRNKTPVIDSSSSESSEEFEESMKSLAIDVEDTNVKEEVAKDIESSKETDEDLEQWLDDFLDE